MSLLLQFKTCSGVLQWPSLGMCKAPPREQCPGVAHSPHPQSSADFAHCLHTAEARQEMGACDVPPASDELRIGEDGNLGF